jgi:hypothetical protein
MLARASNFVTLFYATLVKIHKKLADVIGGFVHKKVRCQLLIYGNSEHPKSPALTCTKIQNVPIFSFGPKNTVAAAITPKVALRIRVLWWSYKLKLPLKCQYMCTVTFQLLVIDAGPR